MAVVVLLPTAFAPNLARSGDTAALGAQAAMATPGTAAMAPGDAAAGVSRRAAQVAQLDPDEPRQWLRSVSTAPQRPRLPAQTSAPRERSTLTWNARLRIDEPRSGALATTLATEGIRHATMAFVADTTVTTGHGTVPLRVAFVDPGGFRVFTPSITGEAEPLWHGLHEGQVLLTHHAARRLGVGPDDPITLGADEPTRVVGAASLGTGHVADAVVSAHAIDRRRFEGRPIVLAGVQRLREIDQTVARLAAAGVGEVRRVRDPQPYRAELTGDHRATIEAFEPFTFVPARERGWLQVEPAWIKRNIVRERVPIIGEVVCHRLMVPQLRAALTEVVERDLAALLDPDDYGGCFAPRHIGRNPTSMLSMHAWGLAVDFNVHTNLMGRPPQLDPRIIEIFERHGFNWGGRWNTPDGMHFELGVLLETP